MISYRKDGKFMRAFLIFVLFALCMPQYVNSQTKEYPYPLRPGEIFRASTTDDTLYWIMKSLQFDNAIKNSIAYEQSKDLIENLKVKANKLEEILGVNATTISLLIKERNSAMAKLEEAQKANERLEEMEIRALRLKRWTLFSGLIGIGAGAIMGAILIAN